MTLLLIPTHFLSSCRAGVAGRRISTPAHVTISKRIQFAHAAASIVVAYQSCSPKQPQICPEAARTRLRRSISDAALRRAVASARHALRQEANEDATHGSILTGLRRFIAKLARTTRRRRFHALTPGALSRREHTCTEPGTCCT